MGSASFLGSARLSAGFNALFSRPPWTVDSPDYLRTGRVLSNQDAFAVDTGGQLTQEAVVAQIAAKVAELCGHVAEPPPARRVPSRLRQRPRRPLPNGSGAPIGARADSLTKPS